MPATIKIKNSSTASAVPTSSDLVQGELAVNVTDKRVFTENASGTVVELGTNPSTLTVAADATIYGVKVGRGAGSVSTNTAVGASALAANTTGANNTSSGYLALTTNTSGSNNSAFGLYALRLTTSGASNSALGVQSLDANTTGSYNTAIGQTALFSNTTASQNTALGYQAGYTNSTGANLVAIGYQAGYSSNANNNTFVGYYAGQGTTGSLNTFVGVNGVGYLVTSGAKNTIIGAYSGNQGGLDIRTASNYIVLSDGDGNPRAYLDNNGYFYCTGVYNLTTAGAANVFVTSSDFTLRRSTSALKYKQDIRDLEELDINLLRPIRYKSKCEGDDQTKDHFGVIADEAAEAGFEELVTRGANDEIEGFQYERLTVVLLKKLQVLESEFKAYKEAHP
jgi:hypothetical protein